MVSSAIPKGSQGEEPTRPTIDSSEELSEEKVFEMLSNRRRRYALHFLMQEGETELGELAEQIAAREGDKPVLEVASDERKRVYSALQQSHLPKMDDADVVHFDKRQGVIEPTDAAEELDIYLDVVQSDEIPWSEYYVGLSAVAVALVFAIWLGAYPFTVLPNLIWTGLLTTVFGLSSVCHLLHARKMKLGAGGALSETDRK